ncbi:hypothetical protein BDZ89DRAFT_175459 [Hymenopellis radicata]|nr:hypothetical protein BDZ89DRAFT_175459 [Hymenopellis radicata]
MLALRRKFKSALWAIQVTPDTPKSTLDAQARYYYDAIKKVRPRPIPLCRLLWQRPPHDNPPPPLLSPRLYNSTLIHRQLPYNHIHTHPRPRSNTTTSPRRTRIFALAIANLMVDITRRDAGGQDPRRHALADDFVRARDGTCSAMAKQMVDNVMNHARRGYDFLSQTLHCRGKRISKIGLEI